MDSRVVFADDTWKRPRGMVKDVMIQLGEFYYPVDFMVLDYAPGRTFEQPKVIWVGHFYTLQMLASTAGKV